MCALTCDMTSKTQILTNQSCRVIQIGLLDEDVVTLTGRRHSFKPRVQPKKATAKAIFGIFEKGRGSLPWLHVVNLFDSILSARNLVCMVATNPWMILPFVLLICAIALAPVFAANWWSRYYAKVAFGLGTISLSYYVLVLRNSGRIWHTAHDYISFIMLIGSLFVISGVIHITVKGQARHSVNLIFLFVGAIAANLLGTTGAAMLLIRPWIQMNQSRVAAHHIVFFIFIVANVGGCLTPVGDPLCFLVTCKACQILVGCKELLAQSG